MDSSSREASADAAEASSWRQKRRRWLVIGLASAAGALLAVVVGTAAVNQHGRRGGGSSRKRQARGAGAPSGNSNDSEGSGAVPIPLMEVVRFKERQWFLEDLEASRQGDSNAMLRIAKMYLHGQGCSQSVGMATEWLRKARQQGLYATLDELWAGDPDKLDHLRHGATRASAVARQQALEAQRMRQPNGKAF